MYDFTLEVTLPHFCNIPVVTPLSLSQHEEEGSTQLLDGQRVRLLRATLAASYHLYYGWTALVYISAYLFTGLPLMCFFFLLVSFFPL